MSPYRSPGLARALLALLEGVSPAAVTDGSGADLGTLLVASLSMRCLPRPLSLGGSLPFLRGSSGL